MPHAHAMMSPSARAHSPSMTDGDAGELSHSRPEDALSATLMAPALSGGMGLTVHTSTCVSEEQHGSELAARGQQITVRPLGKLTVV